MKVIIVVPIIGFGRKGFYNSQEIGLAKSLVKQGHSVSIYKGVKKNSGEAETVNLLDGLTVYYIECLRIGVHGFIQTKNFPEDSDIMVLFSDNQLGVFTYENWCTKNKVLLFPYVGIIESYGSASIKKSIMDLFFKSLTLPVYKRHKVFAKTPEISRTLTNMGVINHEIMTVGLDYSCLKQTEMLNRSELRKKWGYNNEDIVLLFIGMLSDEKKPLEMLDIFDKLNRINRKYKLFMIGRGYLKEKVLHRIQESNNSENIKYVEQVPYNEIWESHYISDIFVNMNEKEIFGMAMMEAIYYQSTVVAFSAPGPKIILQGMLDCYLCKSDEEIINSIKLANGTNENRLYNKSRLIELFSWDKMAIRLKELYNSDAYQEKSK